jgi:hypothetical protein
MYPRIYCKNFKFIVTLNSLEKQCPITNIKPLLSHHKTLRTTGLLEIAKSHNYYFDGGN